MQKVDKAKISFWKGKTQTDEQKARKVAKLHERRDAYIKYKAEGGTLKFNEFQSWWGITCRLSPLTMIHT